MLLFNLFFLLLLKFLHYSTLSFASFQQKWLGLDQKILQLLVLLLFNHIKRGSYIVRLLVLLLFNCIARVVYCNCILLVLLLFNCIARVVYCNCILLVLLLFNALLLLLLLSFLWLLVLLLFNLSWMNQRLLIVTLSFASFQQVKRC